MTRTVSPADGAHRRGPSAAERRLAPRVLVDLEVDYALEDNYLFAYITDISTTGIFIRTLAPEPPGTHLNLRFSPPEADPADAGPFELAGVVIWVNPYRPGDSDNLHPGMGVRFDPLDDGDRRSLIDLVRRIAYLT